MKKSQILSLLALSLTTLWGVSSAQDTDSSVRFLPVSLISQFDVGQIEKGELYPGEQILPGDQLNGNFIQRTGVWITQSAIVNNRLHLTMGVGGLFWYPLPSDPTNPATQITQFGPGISQAQATYTFGNLDHPAATLQMGYFPYKYNPDAKDLGEFLFRSGTYPNYIEAGGGWNMIADANYMVEGFRLNFSGWDNRLSLDLLMPLEHDVPPMYDLSPSAVVSVKPVAGLELGAGIDCNHCIAIKPSVESPHLPQNQVITGLKIDSSQVVFDTNKTTGKVTVDPSCYSNCFYTYTYSRDTSSYYTFQGIKLMGRASFDPKAYVPMPILGAEDLKLYAEFAVLGVKDYPYLYNDIFKRMPVMFGINLPTFKLLDVLSFELEYFNSNLPNSTLNPINSQLPLPDILGSAGSVTQQNIDAYNNTVSGGKWKWSVYGVRQIIKGIQVYAQVANDDIRTIDFTAGALPTYAPVTDRPSDWYYLIRLQVGI